MTTQAAGDARASGVATINQPTVAGLDAVIADARTAAQDPDPGPAEPASYRALRERLDAVREHFPPLYQQTMFDPFVENLTRLGQARFDRLLAQDPGREADAGLLMDVAQALLQQGEGYAALGTDAFQEVVSDLYDGFLSAEDRRGVKQPDHGVTPPLVKWGNPDFGPYTWPVTATRALGASAGVVSLPPANARAGLVAWSTLGHETAGHDVLCADEGLQPELADQLRERLSRLGHGLADYWADRIDETSSDVMGLLNMGPSAGLGLIAYFRALDAAYGGTGVLRSVGPDDDPHPADILRGFLAAEVIARLEFTGHGKWSKLVADETLRDVAPIVLAGREIPLELARQSAQLVAETLVTYKARSLELHSLGDIQNWRDRDELKVRALRTALRTAVQPPADLLVDSYAAHAVAASVVEVLADDSQIPQIFARMLAVLKAMHDKNSSWGPLFVRYPGDVKRDRLYYPQRAARTRAPQSDSLV